MKGIIVFYKRLFWDLFSMFLIMGVKMIDYVNCFCFFYYKYLVLLFYKRFLWDLNVFDLLKNKVFGLCVI